MKVQKDAYQSRVSKKLKLDMENKDVGEPPFNSDQGRNASWRVDIRCGLWLFQMLNLIVR